MKRFLAGLVLLATVAGCSNYDPYRITQTQRHKDTMQEVVIRAKAGNLTKVDYESALQSFDTSMIEEQAKKGDGVEKLGKSLDEDSKKKVVELFGEDD